VISRYGRLLASARIGISLARKLNDKITSVIATLSHAGRREGDVIPRERLSLEKHIIEKDFMKQVLQYYYANI